MAFCLFLVVSRWVEHVSQQIPLLLVPLQLSAIRTFFARRLLLLSARVLLRRSIGATGKLLSIVDTAEIGAADPRSVSSGIICAMF